MDRGIAVTFGPGSKNVTAFQVDEVRLFNDSPRSQIGTAWSLRFRLDKEN